MAKKQKTKEKILHTSNKAENVELDRKAAFLLKRMPGITMPNKTPAETREEYLKVGNPFAPKAAELNYTKDHRIGDNELLLREYSPVAEDESSSAILYFHGGGFVIGSVAEFDTVCQNLAHLSGARVYSLDYRLAPEYKFPAAIEDALLAFDWLCQQSTDLFIDSNKIAVGGDSAGGNLSAVICQKLRDNGKQTPAAQLLWYPLTDALSETDSRKSFTEGYYLTADDFERINEWYADKDQDGSSPMLSPGRNENLKELPPALVITAGYDMLRDEGAAYAKALFDAGNTAEHLCYTDMFHAFISFAGGIWQGMHAIEYTARFFKENVGN